LQANYESVQLKINPLREITVQLNKNVLEGVVNAIIKESPILPSARDTYLSVLQSVLDFLNSANNLFPVEAVYVPRVPDKDIEGMRFPNRLWKPFNPQIVHGTLSQVKLNLIQLLTVPIDTRVVSKHFKDALILVETGISEYNMVSEDYLKTTQYYAKYLRDRD